MLELPIAASGLSILASLLSIGRSVKDLMATQNLSTDQALDKFKGNASGTNAEVLAMKGSDSAIKSIVIIPGQLLDQLVSEINGCVDRQVEARKKAKNQAGKDKADRAAAVCVCSGLGSIKLHNSGKLPEGTLRDLWKAYGCN
ncbi:hypothetical protein AB7813_01880 [Tardiphaga sp. 20_F10_N6_6]|jgi:hypothetical protein|uniref:Uncharacterized protein n=1 Tax=Tardiphaga robiniae TaxID=943830 RepID=A0A7G6TVJ1_9BRAD|nr:MULTISPECIES: hypothetical protein [Tardiphaga]QND70773.1 hypothetical protein HB776_05640 [Tardiphaga robiniae]UFS78380.1 hypothetical protein LPB73_13795 [Tardiphaga sp. 37S4]